MTDFRGNIDHWLKQSEPDYFIFFLKAWIPFNAWYVVELPHLNKKDTKIIRELLDNPKSRPREIIENFISKDNYTASKFREHLSQLHYHLESKSLKHNGSVLSFNKLALGENPKKFAKETDNEGNIYKAEVKTGFHEAIIVDKGGRTILHFKQPIYRSEDLKKDNDFIKITNRKIQQKILSCYEEINPNKTISLVSNSKVRSDYIPLLSENKINFINDPTTIAKGCIQILYSLRCMLFHGEIEPINNNKPVYEHSYYLLRLLIKELH